MHLSGIPAASGTETICNKEIPTEDQVELLERIERINQDGYSNQSVFTSDLLQILCAKMPSLCEMVWRRRFLQND